MAKAGGKKDTRAARERTRVYRARQQFHRGTVRRRTRDNVMAGVAGGILILAIIGGQLLYYTEGPGGPTPTPTATPEPTAPALEPPTPLPTPSSTP